MLTPTAPNHNNKLTKQVIISSRLADQMGALGQIYYLARWFDSAQWKDSGVGSGCVQIPVRAAAAELNRSIPTIRSNIYAACRRGYFWSAHIKDGIATIYYKSEGRIGAEMQISEYGARSRIALSKLKDLRVRAPVARIVETLPAGRRSGGPPAGPRPWTTKLNGQEVPDHA